MTILNLCFSISIEFMRALQLRQSNYKFFTEHSQTAKIFCLFVNISELSVELLENLKMTEPQDEANTSIKDDNPNPAEPDDSLLFKALEQFTAKNSSVRFLKNIFDLALIAVLSGGCGYFTDKPTHHSRLQHCETDIEGRFRESFSRL